MNPIILYVVLAVFLVLVCYVIARYDGLCLTKKARFEGVCMSLDGTPTFKKVLMRIFLTGEKVVDVRYEPKDLTRSHFALSVIYTQCGTSISVVPSNGDKYWFLRPYGKASAERIVIHTQNVESMMEWFKFAKFESEFLDRREKTRSANRFRSVLPTSPNAQ